MNKRHLKSNTKKSDRIIHPIKKLNYLRYIFFLTVIYSEKASLGRFSPLFYGRKDQQLPFTDSDGLYDFPSSDGKGTSTVTYHTKKLSTKRRDRKSSRLSNIIFYQFFIILI